jgi:hypothetical protein
MGKRDFVFLLKNNSTDFRLTLTLKFTLMENLKIVGEDDDAREMTIVLDPESERYGFLEAIDPD